MKKLIRNYYWATELSQNLVWISTPLANYFHTPKVQCSYETYTPTDVF